MTTRDKLEKVLEYIINEETDKASDLLHDVFVEKARGIYENLVAEDEVTEDEILDENSEDVNEESEQVDEASKDEDNDDKEDVDEAIVKNPEQDFAQEVTNAVDSDLDEIESEEMYSEDEMDDEEEMPIDDEGGDTGDPEVDQAFVDAEEALDRLKAEFMELVGGADEAPMDDEMPMDAMDAEDGMEEMESVEQDGVAETVEEDFEEIEEAANMVAVKDPSDPVGADGGAQKSPVASKNDMGGSAVNMANSGSEGDHGVGSVSEDTAGNVNQPGNKAPKGSSMSADNAEHADNKKSPMGS